MYRGRRNTTQGCTYARNARRRTQEVDTTRNYQRKLNNRYWLPDDVYRRAVAHVRAYPDMCRRRDEVLFSSPGGDGPRGGGVGDPTATKALQLARIEDDIAAVDRALEKIPRDYRQGLIDNLAFGKPMYTLPGACVETWSRWRGAFLYHIARIMHWI
jgi:hypothetical protein